ncbi:MAG TPA: SLC13 family permease [Thermoanaerobaculia bacterium]|nr:SLC13 family permease [Thermoanaerobaculia bacterium]
MTGEILLLLALLAAAVALFATEWIAPELTAVLLLLALVFTGLLPAADAFAGFGSDVVVFLGSIFVVSQAMVRTGVLERLERAMARAAERFPRRIVALLVAATAGLSSLLSNTATVAAMLPVASGLARRLRLSPSRLYMPLAFASILGGSLTLIGTSTNVVVAAALPRFDQAAWGLFELAPAALPGVGLGLLYLLTVGRRLLPERGGEAADLYRLREYVSEAVVPAGSPWASRSLRQLRAGADLDITVLGRIQDDAVEPIAASEPLAAGDRLLVKADREALLRLKVRQELDLVVDRAAAAAPPRGPAVREVVLPHGSRLSGRTLRELAFGSRYRVMVVALFRRGEPLLDRISSIALLDGDLLLVQGDLDALGELLQGGHLILLEEAAVPAAGSRMWLAGGAFAGMLLAGGSGLLPFPLAALAAAAAVLLLRCLTPRQAYEAIDWGALVLVGSLLALGAAMETSGAGRYFTVLLAGAAEGFAPIVLLAGFYLLTAALTQPMSNQAAALVVLPLAVLAAEGLDLNPRAFAAAVTLAASCSFISPLEPASLLVYGPGRYRFGDYFRVGLPLTVLVFAANLFMIPRVWPLQVPATGHPALAAGSRAARPAPIPPRVTNKRDAGLPPRPCYGFVIPPLR